MAPNKPVTPDSASGNCPEAYKYEHVSFQKGLTDELREHILECDHCLKIVSRNDRRTTRPGYNWGCDEFGMWF